MNTCGSKFKAIDHANARYSAGYTSTGVGAVVCARHGMIRKNGVCNLQKGERYANMDYIFLSTLIDSSYLQIFVLYDIACQWSKKLAGRIAEFPSSMHLDIQKTSLMFGIPKAHIKSHGEHCQSRYSLNYLPGSARTDGESIERDWAHTNALAMSTREMGSGNREETLDDHWGAWNWHKLTHLGLFSSFDT